jgi:hypothetical protein
MRTKIPIQLNLIITKSSPTAVPLFGLPRVKLGLPPPRARAKQAPGGTGVHSTPATSAQRRDTRRPPDPVLLRPGQASARWPSTTRSAFGRPAHSYPVGARTPDPHRTLHGS